MGAVSERTKPNHRGRAMPEVSALMQVELPGAGDRLPTFFEKGEKTKMKLELIKASDVEIKEVEWQWNTIRKYNRCLLQRLFTAFIPIIFMTKIKTVVVHRCLNVLQQVFILLVAHISQTDLMD